MASAIVIPLKENVRVELGVEYLEQMQFVGAEDRLGPTFYIQLGVDVSYMFFHRAEADDQRIGNRLI